MVWALKSHNVELWHWSMISLCLSRSFESFALPTEGRRRQGHEGDGEQQHDGKWRQRQRATQRTNEAPLYIVEPPSLPLLISLRPYSFLHRQLQSVFMWVDVT